MAFEEAFGFPALLTLLNVVAAVVTFFTLGEGDFQFCVTPVGKKELEGDESETFLGKTTLKAFQFVFLEKELFRAARIDGNIAALVVRGDIKVVNVEFGTLKSTEGILKIGGAGAQRFDFWAGKDDASRIAFQDLVVMKRFSVSDCGGHSIKVRRTSILRLSLCPYH